MCSDKGFLVAGLLPALLLLLSALAGLLDISWRAQNRVAMQSRLDICAVKLALKRERSLEGLARLNGALRATVVGIYAARGVAVVSGPIGLALGKGAEAALLAANKALAASQNSLILAGTASELAGSRCASTPFSSPPAACLITPLLAKALHREATLFPDVEGSLAHQNPAQSALARVRCRGKFSAATLAIRGDAGLRETRFTDVYQE